MQESLVSLCSRDSPQHLHRKPISEVPSHSSYFLQTLLFSRPGQPLNPPPQQSPPLTNRYSPAIPAEPTVASASTARTKLEIRAPVMLTRSLISAPGQQSHSRYSPAVPALPLLKLRPRAQRLLDIPLHPRRLGSFPHMSSARDTVNSSLTNGSAPPPHRFAPRTSSPLAQHNQRPTIDRAVTAPMKAPVAGLDYDAPPLPPKPGGRYKRASAQCTKQPEVAPCFCQPTATTGPEHRAPRCEEQVLWSMALVLVCRHKIAVPSQPAIGIGSQTLPEQFQRGYDLDEFVLPQDDTAADPLERWKSLVQIHHSHSSHGVSLAMGEVKRRRC
ncbi:hypothetical protein MRB53_038706 [Persea americana]|nr:hypothetical protein MRB53_038706 [Persea americana]